MQMIFSWLHLSDLHAGHGPESHGWDQSHVIARLRADLALVLEGRDAVRPQAVFLTGDVAFSGDSARPDSPVARDGEYRSAAAWLEDLARLIGIGKKSIFVVPGNHDVQRAVDEKDKQTKRLVDGIRLGAESLDKALADPEDRALLRKRLANYFKFSAGFAEDARATDEAEGLFWSASLPLTETAGHCVRVVGLNTVLVGGRPDDEGKLRLGQAQLDRLRREPSEIVLALSHHPIDWLFDRERALARMQGAVDVHLFGHVHKPETEHLRRGGGRATISICAGAVHADSSDGSTGHGYSLGAVYQDDEDLVVRVWPRRWDERSDRFVVHSEQTETNQLFTEHRLHRRLAAAPGRGRSERRVSVQSADRGEAGGDAFEAQREAPFLAMIAARDRIEENTLLFADRFLLMTRSRPELADLPHRIKQFLAGQSGAAAAAQVEQDWLRALAETVGAERVVPSTAPEPTLRLLEPVARCVTELRAALCRLVTRALPRELINDGRFAMMREQRHHHLKRLRGRDQYVEHVLTYLNRHESRAVLITAPEGMGKSAIAAAVSERLRGSGEPIGPGAALVRRECDWLPGALLLFGKVENDPERIVQLLLAQANAMLLRPVLLPAEPAREGAAYLREDASSGFAMDDESLPLGRVAVLPGWPGRPPERSSILRSTLLGALCRLVEERGPTVLIVDALDEISVDGALLSFLPDVVPEGVSLLLVTRPEEGILQRLRPLHPLHLTLEGVDEATAGEITGVRDPAQLRTLREETQGSPLLLGLVADRLHDGSPLEQVQLRTEARHVFDGQVARWRDDELEERRDPLYQALLLLAVAEPVAPLPLDTVQGFLTSCGLPLSQNELRTRMRLVASQVDGLGSDRVKLATRKLAEHVCFDRLSRRDRTALLARVAEWLAADDFVEDELRMRFLRVWTDPAVERDRAVQQAAGSLIDKLAAAKKAERLYAIWYGWPDTAGTPLAAAEVRCLRAAAELAHPMAMQTLGLRLLDGEGMEAQPAEGESWLRKAAALGDGRAMAHLGDLLLEGEKLKQDLSDGESWLRKAAEAGYAWAAARLGWRLDGGRLLKQDQAEAELWLRKAADAQDRWAMRQLATKLLDGNGCTRRPTEGEALLRRTAALGDGWANAVLGWRLLKGRGVKQDCAEGEAFLRRSADSGDQDGMRLLGLHLLDGDGLKQDLAEGESWLRKAVEAGDGAAMAALGLRLLEGSGLPKDTTQGEAYLRRAAASNDLWGMWNLGERLLDGDGIKQDLGEGESWLRKSADGQNCCAQRLLGERLLDGRGVRQDRQEGERLLRLSAHSGHRCGMRPLAERLLDGRGLKRDRAEGILWLREAAAAGFVRAMVSLGWRLAEGRALKQDLIEAESWLRKAAEVGDAEGMGLLGGLMITRDGSAENAQAEAWLRQAAARGDASATGTLGLHLLEGGRLAQDEAQGELWLRRAAGAGSLGAAASLGVHLYRRSLVHGVRPWPLKEVEGIFRAVWRVERSVGTNLAYMHRRKETSATKTPIDKLLARGLKDGSSFAIVNLALCHAAGFERPVDPESADRLFATLPRDEELKDVIAWWQDVHASGDAEGGYVLAMLARHGFVEASAQELSAWQDMARTAGWPFPTEAARQKKPRLGAKKPHPRAKKPRRDS